MSVIDQAGYVVYVVGGTVRDFVGCGLFPDFAGRLSKKPDFDLATSATPDQLIELFPRAITVGKAFGVIKLPMSDGSNLEIATFREDLDYRDHRHPTGVKFSGPEEDARRRDFTINALFFDVKTQRILDTVGGVADLRAGLVRAIGEPDQRFQEDALRLLRVVRFASQFGFKVEPQTREAVRAKARLIHHVSPERIREELTRMWIGPAPDQALSDLHELGLLKLILPELEEIRGVELPPFLFDGGSSWAFTLKLLKTTAQTVSRRSDVMGWAAVLYEIGKPRALKKNSGRNFNGHEIEATELASQIIDRLRFSREEGDQIIAILGDRLKFREVFQMRDSTIARAIADPHFAASLELHRAEAMITDGNLAFFAFWSERLQHHQVRQSLVHAKILDGKDLIQLGLTPGPEFSRILRTVEDLYLDGRLTTKEEALEHVLKYYIR